MIGVLIDALLQWVAVAEFAVSHPFHPALVPWYALLMGSAVAIRQAGLGRRAVRGGYEAAARVDRWRTD